MLAAPSGRSPRPFEGTLGGIALDGGLLTSHLLFGGEHRLAVDRVQTHELDVMVPPGQLRNAVVKERMAPNTETIPAGAGAPATGQTAQTDLASSMPCLSPSEGNMDGAPGTVQTPYDVAAFEAKEKELLNFKNTSKNIKKENKNKLKEKRRKSSLDEFFG